MQFGTGAMMTEIGLAQQRLFDDDGSNAGHNQSMSTSYPSGISEPCSFPMHFDHLGRIENLPLADPVSNTIPHEATQLVAPHITNGYQYSTPAESPNAESPMTNADQVATVPTSNHPNGMMQSNPHNTTQRSKSLHTEWNSPHDTEPNSSVRSPQLNRSKSEHGQAAIIPPVSPASTHDELSAPAFTVEVAPSDLTSVKKRGRPKKQISPQDDEDDELALGHNPDSISAKTEKRRPGRPSKSEKPAETKSNEEADGFSAHQDVDGSGNPPKQGKLESKKRKIKRSKTAPETLQNSNKLDEDGDDDVIWVESRPLEPDNANSQMTQIDESKNASKLPEETSAENPIVEAPAPAPKKRGRKRKKPVEEPKEAPTTSEYPQSESKQEDPIASEAIEQPMPMPEPPKIDEKEDALSKQSESEATPQPNLATNPSTVESAPQTPQLKKPRKVHSPISSTSKVPYRVGLSKRARIAPLLKVVRK